MRAVASVSVLRAKITIAGLLLPVVASRDEVKTVIERLQDHDQLIARLLYGTGMRIHECLGMRSNSHFGLVGFGIAIGIEIEIAGNQREFDADPDFDFDPDDAHLP